MTNRLIIFIEYRTKIAISLIYFPHILSLLFFFFFFVRTLIGHDLSDMRSNEMLVKKFSLKRVVTIYVIKI